MSMFLLFMCWASLWLFTDIILPLLLLLNLLRIKHSSIILQEIEYQFVYSVFITQSISIWCLDFFFINVLFFYSQLPVQYRTHLLDMLTKVSSSNILNEVKVKKVVFIRENKYFLALQQPQRKGWNFKSYKTFSLLYKEKKSGKNFEVEKRKNKKRNDTFRSTVTVQQKKQQQQKTK